MSDEKLKAALDEPRLATEADKAAGRVTVGGQFWHIFHSSAEKAYREAAKVMIDHALAQGEPENFVQPCVYLLRHAIELELKGLISLVWRIEEMFLSDAKGAWMSVKRNCELDREHGLMVLHNVLVEALRVLSTHLTEPIKLPKAFTSLVVEVDKADDTDHTRWRYDRGIRGRYKSESFPDKVTLHLRRWLERLNAYHAQHGDVRLDYYHHDDKSFAEELCLLDESITQGLLDSGVLTLEQESETP